ncbi:MAG: hypothetical protein ACOYT8_03925 [Candidatus Dependentiae bacterium]
MKFKLIFKKLIFLSTLFIACSTKPMQNKPSSLLRTAVDFSASCLVTGLCHELGHAIPAQLFFNNVAGIRIGQGPSIKFNIAKFFLEIGLYPFLDGQTVFTTPNFATNTKADLFKLLITVAAGPISGAASCYGLFKALKNNYIQSNPTMGNCLRATFLLHLINFLPGEGFDGSKILQTLFLLIRHKK